jgi:predicted tellurium resistance membrane protein TerC
MYIHFAIFILIRLEGKILEAFQIRLFWRTVKLIWSERRFCVSRKKAIHRRSMNERYGNAFDVGGMFTR